MSTSDAANALGCSVSTVRNMFHAGDLAGTQGVQPKRPRIFIQSDESGRPLDRQGRPVSGSPLRSHLDALARRVEAIESRHSSSSEAERLRDAALLQQGVIEGQQRAYDLQAQAARAQLMR